MNELINNHCISRKDISQCAYDLHNYKNKRTAGDDGPGTKIREATWRKGGRTINIG